MHLFRILVDGVDTGYTIMEESAEKAANVALTCCWWNYLESFKQYGKFGVVTAIGPAHFPDGSRDTFSV